MEINMTAVVVALIANFFLGFLWYTPLFGKAWAKEMGIEVTGKPPAGAMVKGLSIMVIGNFLMAYVFAHNIMAWSFVPETKDMSRIANIMNASIFTWIGFYLPGDLSRVAWEKASWKLFAINTVYHYLTLLVAASVLIYM